MKKLTFILALATLALFSQCKKQDATQDNPTNGIQMVLKADNGGSRTTFGANGSISWNTNEKIYVVTGGQCVGYVTNGNEGGNTFTGTLTGITANGTYDFHYYYVGNTQTIANEATSFTMDFSDQDGTLANLGNFHVGYGVQNGVEVTLNETVTTEATMHTLVAMAYFDLAGMAEAGEKVYFYGDNINNRMTIDFSTNEPTFSQTNAGGQNLICAGTVAEGATSPCYVMLLPNHTDGTEELSTDITFISKRTTGTCNGVFNYGIVGGRFYCNEGNTESAIPVTTVSYEPGTLRGMFSVSETKTVHFSQGNLQYIGSASTPYWQFAENQWDYLGDGQEGSYEDEYVDRDLFGWGTSGYNHGAINYQPWNTGRNNDHYYAYGVYDYDLYSQTPITADWGYNAISNGGDMEGLWRTLSRYEWDYVFDTRSTVSGILYAMGYIDDVAGIIILPDDWSADYYTLNSTNDLYASYETNVIDGVVWAKCLETNGAIFLPAAGYRIGTTVYVDGCGYYWSSTYGYSDMPCHVKFDGSWFYPNYYYKRYMGYSVRLARDAD